MMKLNARALGFSVGLIGGIIILLLTLGSLWTARVYGKYCLYSLASVLPGYDISTNGALLGLCYGFAGGFGAGWLVAKLYNFFAKE
ncbi:MAG: hypothetical protein KKI13_03105 [Candidatus Omnitrophica bacterium]|nr:hypothetical protein [Candidatus Omnitrophota bacterium]MCG2704831.1 hypothetical protein [Candidatus Omnitrophota bacterium]